MQGAHKLTWKPLWHFLLDTALTSSYRIADCKGRRPYGELSDYNSYKVFKIVLANQLHERSERLKKFPAEELSALTQYIHLALSVDRGSLVQVTPNYNTIRLLVYW